MSRLSFLRTALVGCLALTLAFGSAADARNTRKGPADAAGQAIAWGERITLTPPVGSGRYPRLLQIRKGAHAGDLLLFYQTQMTGGDFWMYRSTDNGYNWGQPVLVNKAGNGWNYASCNVIQLEDGRLMMSMQRRLRGSNLAQDYYIDVRYSADGGQSWGAAQTVFQGANWEGRPIQVPHDANGDGARDIYLFFTQRAVPTNVPTAQASRADDYGRAVAWVASYDGGRSWTDPNPERFTGRIVQRNFQEAPGKGATDDSGGGMPTPFVLPGPRIAFVAEQIEKAASPYVVASDPGDWDWISPAFQGAWTSADYNGIGDDSVYPARTTNAWRMNDKEFGGAPYGTVLPDGRVVVSVNTKLRINVWVGDRNARNFSEQARPFGAERSFYSFIEPLSDREILVGAGPVDEGDGSFIYLRRGRID
ncbi:BNR repeat-like domain-containing protein [Gemmobacter aquatilis]|uniref:BNR repeat-like domain-containing protein n=1 Tax=Gemmobacter aquatilis TaxID=933059 RepID=A0A1H8NJY0_9RHOB|nr:sialidase family protein [Gemmobacter aquatilis]SEO29876.1 BNR repeat-like domain-containing protein [Gemmobacter aquatilis]